MGIIHIKIGVEFPAPLERLHDLHSLWIEVALIGKKTAGERGGILGEPLAVKVDCAAGGKQPVVDDVKQRGFAGAVPPKKPIDGILLKMKIHV